MTSIDLDPSLPGSERELGELLAVRRALLQARANASSPAVDRALEMADTYLFLGISYLGYAEEIYPEEATLADRST